MTKDKLKELAENYAHCYSFVGDDTMPVAQAKLMDAIDELFKPDIQLSICTYNSGAFQVMVKHGDYDITFEGERKLSEEEFVVVNMLAPACLFTPYKML